MNIMFLHISGSCQSHTLEILGFLLGAFLLGYLLRYFLGAKHRNRVKELESELGTWKSKYRDFEMQNESLTADLKSCKSNKSMLRLELEACKEQLSSGSTIDNASHKSNINEKIESDISTSTLGFASSGIKSEKGGQALASGFGAMLQDDNLQLVEGIGPKIESVLKDNGIKTWAELSNRTPESISSLLMSINPRYRIHDPSTWPKQAQYAHEGKWPELIEYQKFLGGGKEGQNINSNTSKVETMHLKAIGLKAFSPDDLKVVEGIGPKIEQLLKNAGIQTHRELAESSVERIQAVLEAAGDRFKLADPGTWPKQARLAADEQWEELKKYQDHLQGGKE